MFAVDNTEKSLYVWKLPEARCKRVILPLRAESRATRTDGHGREEMAVNYLCAAVL